MAQEAQPMQPAGSTPPPADPEIGRGPRREHRRRSRRRRPRPPRCGARRRAPTTRSRSSRSTSGSSRGASSSTTGSRSSASGCSRSSCSWRSSGRSSCRSTSTTSPSPTRSSTRVGRRRSRHIFGETGGLQRDVFNLVVNGARTSLFIGFSSMLLGVLIGTIVGAVAGYVGGFLDNVLMRTVDVFLSIPLLFLILVASRFFGNGNVTLIVVIFAFFSWMGIARLTRSLFLSIREREFVEAARAVGVRDRRIIFRHILPSAISPIVVSASLLVAANIIAEAFVSFLGLRGEPHLPHVGEHPEQRAHVHPPRQLVVAVLPRPHDHPHRARGELHRRRPAGRPGPRGRAHDGRDGDRGDDRRAAGGHPAGRGHPPRRPRPQDVLQRHGRPGPRRRRRDVRPAPHRHGGDRRRVRVREERDRPHDHAPARHPAGRDRRRRDLVRRQGPPRPPRGRDAPRARQRHRDDLPGAAHEPEPGPHDRRPDRRAGPRPHEGHRSRRRGTGRSRRSGSSASRAPSSA